jgi:hypothetical protein
MRSQFIVSTLLGACALQQMSAAAQARDNHVTVSQNGGDYMTLVAAAENAREGDQWCVAPSAQHPCVIHIGSGIFFNEERLVVPGGVHLVGDGKNETLLVGGGIVASGRVSDLTISSAGTALEQDESASLDFLVQRVALRGGAVGLDVSDSNTVLRIVDSDIVAIDRSAEKVYGIFARTRTGQVRVIRTRITAIGGQETWGYNDNSDERFGDIAIRECTVFASGEQAATALLLNNELSDYTVIGGSFTAISPGSAISIATSESSVKSITVVGAKATAQGGQSAAGVNWGDSQGGATLILDGVSIDATDAVLVRLGEGAVRASIWRSQLFGSRTALSTTIGLPGSVTLGIASSLLQAPTAVSIGNTQLEARSSVFAGDVIFSVEGLPPSSGTCRKVYDANHELLPPTCVPASAR